MEFIQVNFVFSLAILVMSVVIHEVSHGFMAYFLGDPTAKMAGRLTLNPIKHVDPVGSLLVPGILALLPGSIIFGWAKPVPYNPYNLQAGKVGPALVAAAGPASNFFLALVFGLLIRFLPVTLLTPQAISIMSLVVAINLMLAIFNLLPVPPLDGSQILFSLLPYRWRFIEELFVRYQIVIILVVIFGAGFIVSGLTSFLFRLFTGM